MVSKLGLRGLAKEIFAIIFGFWLSAKRSSTLIPISRMRAITGGSNPAIIEAIKNLEHKGYISVSRTSGQFSSYTVTLDASIIQDFEATFSKPVINSLNRSGVKPPNRGPLTQLTGGSKATIPVYNNSNKNGNKSINVGDKDEFKVPDQI